MKKLLIVTALFGAVGLVACGGGGNDQVFGAAADTTLSADKTTGPTIARAISGDRFDFASVPDFATQTTTSVTITATNTTSSPTFVVKDAANTASGYMDFGSCIFVIQTSTYPAGSPLAAGNAVTINPCQVKVATRGISADGTAVQSSATLLLRNAVSTGTPVTVSINNGGQVTLNGVPAGTVTVAFLTGG